MDTKCGSPPKGKRLTPFHQANRKGKDNHALILEVTRILEQIAERQRLDRRR